MTTCARAHCSVHGVDVERRVGKDEVEAAGGLVRVVVVAVDVAAVFDFAFEAVDGEVQAAKAAGFVGFLDSTPWIESSAAGFFLCSETKREGFT